MARDDNTVDLSAFAAALRRLARESPGAGERVGSLIDSAKSVAVAVLVRELGLELRRAEVVGVTVTCWMHEGDTMQRARVTQSIVSDAVAAELSRYGHALVEMTVEVDNDLEPTGVVVLTIKIER